MDIDHAINSYEIYLSIERKLSNHYVKSSVRTLNRFRSFLSKKNKEDVDKIEEGDVPNYLEKRINVNLSKESLGLEIVIIRQFFRFLSKKDLWKKSDSILPDTIKKGRILPKTANLDEVKKILSEIIENTPFDVRDIAIIELLYGSGLRASELCELSLESINFEDKLLRVTGKGNKERIVPFGKKAEVALRKYLRDSRPLFLRKKKDPYYVFLSYRKTKLTRSGLWQMVKKRAKEAGIDTSFFPHLFRHSFATHMLDNGADIRSISHMLGHADMSTTQIYTHVSTSKLKNIHKKFHPRG